MIEHNFDLKSTDSIAFNSAVKLAIVGFTILGVTLWANPSSPEGDRPSQTPKTLQSPTRTSTLRARRVGQKSQVTRYIHSKNRPAIDPFGGRPIEMLKAWAQAHRAPIIYGQRFSVQTGPYAQVVLAKAALNSRCMAQIVKAAYKLQNLFSDYTFVIDSQIQHCQNLAEGVKQMIASKAKVEKNLSTFSTPMHSVFLTNRSRFNHYAVGEMGLHVDVNVQGEIQKRLVDFKIKEPAIPHESGPG